MIVPITSAKGAPAMAQIPSQTNLMMALATMHKLGRFDQPDDAQKAFRDAQYGTKDQPNQRDIDKLDLGHAVPEDGSDVGGSELIPWRKQIIDVNKLSPKELKAIGR